MNRKPSQRRLGVESLESRTLLAGNLLFGEVADRHPVLDGADIDLAPITHDLTDQVGSSVERLDSSADRHSRGGLNARDDGSKRGPGNDHRAPSSSSRRDPPTLSDRPDNSNRGNADQLGELEKGLSLSRLTGPPATSTNLEAQASSGSSLPNRVDSLVPFVQLALGSNESDASPRGPSLRSSTNTDLVSGSQSSATSTTATDFTLEQSLEQDLSDTTTRSVEVTQDADAIDSTRPDGSESSDADPVSDIENTSDAEESDSEEMTRLESITDEALIELVDQSVIREEWSPNSESSWELDDKLLQELWASTFAPETSPRFNSNRILRSLRTVNDSRTDPGLIAVERGPLSQPVGQVDAIAQDVQLESTVMLHRAFKLLGETDGVPVSDEVLDAIVASFNQVARSEQQPTSASRPTLQVPMLAYPVMAAVTVATVASRRKHRLPSADERTEDQS